MRPWLRNRYCASAELALTSLCICECALTCLPVAVAQPASVLLLLVQVKWSNLETLLVLGAKLDMPAILAHAAAFIQNHMCLLDMAEGGMRFIWK